jgi:hypothetical protein
MDGVPTYHELETDILTLLLGAIPGGWHWHSSGFLIYLEL